MDKIIYCFWTGDNKMSKDRLKGLQTIREKSNVEVKVITKDNLESYILPDHPLHNCYKYLNLTHKSDYLRSYFMHFYGGGYCDIKTIRSSWVNAFEKLESSDKYILGYKEVGPGGVAFVGGDLYKTLTTNWYKLIGCGSFICKPLTVFTKKWYDNVTKRMNERSDDLEKRGDVLQWTEIMGHIFHPLCYEYSDNIIQDDSVKPDFSISWR